MNVELTAEEMELVLHALKEHGQRRRDRGLSTEQVDDLVARLEVVERENRAPRTQTLR